MRREPKVGIQYRPEHFHGVAAEGQIVGNDLGDEAAKRADHSADAVAINALEAHAENDGAPANKNRRRIKIGHGGAALEAHAVNQPESMDHPGQTHQVKRRPADHFRTVEPKSTPEYEGQHINDRSLFERLEIVEEHFATT